MLTEFFCYSRRSTWSEQASCCHFTVCLTLQENRCSRYRVQSAWRAKSLLSANNFTEFFLSSLSFSLCLFSTPPSPHFLFQPVGCRPRPGRSTKVNNIYTVTSAQTLAKTQLCAGCACIWKPVCCCVSGQQTAAGRAEQSRAEPGALENKVTLPARCSLISSSFLRNGSAFSVQCTWI